jgi:hypothetical protein
MRSTVSTEPMVRTACCSSICATLCVVLAAAAAVRSAVSQMSQATPEPRPTEIRITPLQMARLNDQRFDAARRAASQVGPERSPVLSTDKGRFPGAGAQSRGPAL